MTADDPDPSDRRFAHRVIDAFVEGLGQYCLRQMWRQVAPDTVRKHSRPKQGALSQERLAFLFLRAQGRMSDWINAIGTWDQLAAMRTALEAIGVQPVIQLPSPRLRVIHGYMMAIEYARGCEKPHSDRLTMEEFICLHCLFRDGIRHLGELRQNSDSIKATQIADALCDEADRLYGSPVRARAPADFVRLHERWGRAWIRCECIIPKEWRGVV